MHHAHNLILSLSKDEGAGMQSSIGPPTIPGARLQCYRSPSIKRIFTASGRNTGGREQT